MDDIKNRTLDKLKVYIENNSAIYGKDVKPIFEILVFEKPNEEVMYNGKHSGFPDMGCQSNVGFYYDLADAIEAVECNVCDIREMVYDAAFIICRFPGLYNCVGLDGRIFFIWDTFKDGYVEAEEPELFKHIAL